MLLWPALATIALAIAAVGVMREKATLQRAADSDARVEAVEIMARRFEHFVHAQAAVAGSDIALLGDGAGIHYTSAPLGFAASPVDPAHWYDADGMDLAGDVVVEWIVARQAEWPRATGLIVVRAPDDMRLVEVVRMERKLRLGAVEGTGIEYEAEDLFEAVIGRAPTDREIVVYAFRFLGFPGEAVRRDLWVGYAAPSMDTDLDLDGNDVSDVSRIVASDLTSPDGAGVAMVTETATVTEGQIDGDLTVANVFAGDLVATGAGSTLDAPNGVTTDDLTSGAMSVTTLTIAGAGLDGAAFGAGSGGSDLSDGAAAAFDLEAASATVVSDVTATTFFTSGQADIAGDVATGGIAVDAIEVLGDVDADSLVWGSEMTAGTLDVDALTINTGGSCLGC